MSSQARSVRVDRDISSFPHQTRFGKADNPPGERGSCFQTCLSSILDLPLDEVPHFFDTDETSEQQDMRIKKWLVERSWFCVWIPWEWVGSDWICISPQALVIISGKSPRGDWGHVVIGRVSEEDKSWHIEHDPHPSNDGIDGTPLGYYLVAPTLSGTGSP